MAHTFTRLLYHAVFSTKNRSPSIDSELKPSLFPYLGGIVRDMNGRLLTANGTEDHVHMLLSLPQTVSVADALRMIKTNSSGWIHRQRPKHKDFGWQTGYGAFSVSESNRETVARYIEKQEEHHRKMTFQEEFIRLLERHGIDYDPQYLWD